VDGDAVRCPGCKKTVIAAIVPALSTVVFFETNPTWVLVEKPVQGCVPHLCATEIDRARVRTRTEKKNKG